MDAVRAVITRNVVVDQARLTARDAYGAVALEHVAKDTKLGPGYIQTNLQTFYNQKGEFVGTNLYTLLRYGGS